MRRVCSEKGCEQPVHGRDRCSRHYWQWKKATDPRRCKARGCDRQLHARGYCGKHYERLLYGREIEDLPPTCGGEMPDGTACSRPVREEGGYCFIHNPIRQMLRNPTRKPRKRDDEQRDTELLLQEIRAERELVAG
jgi:hypothetical protein